MRATVTNPRPKKGGKTHHKGTWHKRSPYENPKGHKRNPQGNPVENPKRKSKKRRVKNPLSKSDLMDGLKMAAGTVGGIVATFVVNKYVSPSVPGFGSGAALANFRGVLEAVPGAVVLAFGGKNPFVKGAGIGLVAGGGYDIAAKNVGSSLGMPALGEERVQFVPVRVPVIGMESVPSVGVERAPAVGRMNVRPVGVESAPSVGRESIVPTVRNTRVGGMIFN